MATVILILLLAAFVRLYHIQWSFSNNGIDEGIMIQRARLVGEGYSLYSELPCDQAPLAFYLGAPFGGDVVPLRTMSALFSILAIAAIMETARRVKGNLAMIAAGLLITIDFAFLRESRLFSLDGISASFLAFSLLPFVIYIQKRSRIWLAAAGLLIGLSAATKLFGVLALLGMILYIVYEGRKENTKPRCIVISAALLTFFSAIPLAAFMSYLGPSDVLDGMVFGQSGRSFEPWLKLSLAAYFGLNIAYAIPLLLPRRTWSMCMEARFLLIMSVVILAFMILQPLVFFHHLALMSPGLAVLTGVFIQDRLETKKARILTHPNAPMTNKRQLKDVAVIAFCVTVLISAGFAGYGLIVQDEPPQVQIAEDLRGISGENDWIISGDPLICAYAGRDIPPEVVNVAYRQHDDLTLEDIEHAISDQNVTVVVVSWRLLELDGLQDLLQEQGFGLMEPHGDSLWATKWADYHAALDFFQDDMGPVYIYWRGSG